MGKQKEKKSSHPISLALVGTVLVVVVVFVVVVVVGLLP